LESLQLLKNPDMAPTDEVLQREFGDWYPVYDEFMTEIRSDRFSFAPQWRYYNDGKAWLCKITHKNKTVVWLSAWTTGFKLGFYFTEKTGAGINDLDISDSLKNNYETHEPIGRLKPLATEVNDVSQLGDIYTLLQYKIGKK